MAGGVTVKHLDALSNQTRREAERYARERADRDQAPMTVWRKVASGHLCTVDVWYVRPRDEQGPEGADEHATYLPNEED